MDVKETGDDGHMEDGGRGNFSQEVICERIIILKKVNSIHGI